MSVLAPLSPSQISSDVHNIPLFDTNSSIGTVSPTLALPEASDVHSSLGSSHGALTVKFAPLPQIDHSRRRSLAPLGASARSRRKRILQEEASSLIWTTDPDVPEENMGDPLIAFAKFVKKTGMTLWRRVRKSGKVVVSDEKLSYSPEPVLDIRPPAVVELGEKGRRAVVGEDKLVRRASWSPIRRTECPEKTRRRRSDLAYR